MATSLSSQLKAIKIIPTEPERTKRPFTRASIIFDPKTAADTDVQTILGHALAGLEVLIQIDNRFVSYGNSLFSSRSVELDRELKGIEENNKINESIASYLRLLSGHLQLAASHKTLEYLIRRYKIHVYNIDELIHCSLPYHDTVVFVRIVQLIDLGNSKWRFLEGVKVSGAPPPRKVIVQQCIRDMGVLDSLCRYATPMKKYHPSAPVVSFFTAVAVEFLGALPVIDSDTVRRILPFVFSGLEPSSKGGRDHKAGALMMVSLLSNRVALAHKPAKSLIESISRVACQDANESADLPWLRMLLMAMVSLVQSQSIEILPKKVFEMVQEIRDFAGVLLGLSKKFNIKKFLSVYLESLAAYSFSEEFYHLALVSTIETFPVKDFIDNIVSKVLTHCLMLSKKADDSNLCESGSRAKKILAAIGKRYPSELQGAVHRFLEDPKIKSNKENSAFENLGAVLGGSSNSLLDISDSMVWYSLEHPKAEVRRATLSSLAASGLLKPRTADPQIVVNIQDAILRRLHDEDFGVIQTALSLNGLSNIIGIPSLIGALRDVLLRCVDTVKTSASFIRPEACDVAISCLDCAISNLPNQLHYSKELATIIFPLLLTFPKTWSLNVKALELANAIGWPFYSNISNSVELISTMKEKKVEPSFSSSVNMKTIGVFAEAFSEHPEEYMTWLIECAKNFELSKTLFFLVLLQSFVSKKEDPDSLLALFRTCFPFLKREWNNIESLEVCFEEEFNLKKLDEDYSRFFDQLLHPNLKALNLNLLVCVFWRLLNAFTSASSMNTMAGNEEALDTLFIFFAGSRSKNVFKEHIHLLVLKCNPSPVQFLSKFYTEEGYSVSVQVESLLSFVTICSQTASLEKSISSSHLQLLSEFPSILVPLSSDNQDTRTAAMKCIETLHTLWHQISISAGKNGNDSVLQRSNWTPSLGEFLELLVEQKRLILSDRNFLQSFLMGVLSSSCPNILAPHNIDQRFDKRTKEEIFIYILNSALKHSAYGKLVILSLLRGKDNAIVHVEGVKSLLSKLLERRNKYHFGLDKLFKPLSKIEIETLCFLLECCAAPSSSLIGSISSDYFKEALQVDGFSSEDLAVIQPCVTVLQKLNSSIYSRLKHEIQDQLFEELVFLYRNNNAAIQNAARDAILRVNVTFATVKRLLDLIVGQEGSSFRLSGGKKKKRSLKEGVNLHSNLFCKWESRISFLGSLLDVLLLKKDIENRISLTGPLFKLLSKTFEGNWLLGLVDKDEKCLDASSGVSQTITSTICYIQQTILIILGDISVDLLSDIPQKDDVLNKYDINMLLECVRATKDASTRNHVFSLLSSIAKIVPDKVLEHIISIFTVIGESAAKQSDSHSQSVFEDLVSTIVPCWLSKSNDVDNLLQIFVDVLPEVAEHRRLTIMVYLLRTLGKGNSLASLLVLLIRSAVARKSKSCSDEISLSSVSSASLVLNEWEYKFAMQVCTQYSCMIWLPSLVLLLKQVRVCDKSQNQITELLLAMKFVLQKLQDTELVFKLESEEDLDEIQKTLGMLMEQVLSHLQLVNAKSNLLKVPIDVKKELKECMRSVLQSIANKMLPSSFFEGINLLLGHSDGNVRKKALGFLCETVNNRDFFEPKGKEKRKSTQNSSGYSFHLDELSAHSFVAMCFKIVELVDASDEDLDSSVKLAAISSLEVLANSFSVTNSVFASCLTSVTNQLDSQNLAISCSCLRASGALINVLDTKEALKILPQIMTRMFKKVRDDLFLGKDPKHCCDRTDISGLKESLAFSVLVTLEAVIEKLGRFVSPYLGDIVDLMVLYPEYVSGSDPKIIVKADKVRRLLTEKIVVRYILTPLRNIYPKAVEFGESSVSIVFDMLASLIKTMDRSSISSHRGVIFEHCLAALDLRRTHPESIKKVHVVEQSILRAMIVLTMKLTEMMFKPLFIRSLEWAESEVEAKGSMESRNLDRSISFYSFVNELAAQQRSLFVPYFKYLLEACVRYLTDGQETQTALGGQKRKKAKIEGSVTKEKGGKNGLSPKQWHLNALIISSLQKCFRYDTENQKFLDSTNFQVLLKPIVSQLVAEPPHSMEDFPDVPSVEEVDDLLVTCLGQMAVTAGSDLLWKPLNHEVLMQTRSEKIRPRILGLRVVKYFVEHLKEEYLVLLPETIPFLGELLEDIELPVKSLAQEILKEMEIMSGESLRQYL
ncbi:U3 small nucleolar rna-associated protein [Thalictrum thalictroides]|uniref:U3 small nucleolar rna-associated protein n=1 Tax=Thalictrum thalictroides TaxID=46969 RepID=A0A7J6WBR9_THATH|nr:U3 small nucleolar rna-associated protein [Thalictrum thalictroides]